MTIQADSVQPGGLGRIETRSIDYVPESERHGKVSHQGPFWFLGNFQFVTITLGFIGPSMGLSLGYTILAGALGIFFGTIFMAFHASQGAELGLPQMVQSRAQFGHRGVIIVLFGTLLTYVGLNVIATVLISGGLNNIFGWDPVLVAVVTAAISAILAIYGHDWLHRVFQVFFVISLPLYTLLTLGIITGHAGGTAPADVATFTWTAFLAQFAAGASFNITYAPYVSDYSRYLPKNTKRSSIIAAVFVGASGSAVWLMAVGAWLATHLGASDSLVALRDAGNAMFSSFGSVVALMSVTVLVAANGLNAYSGMLTVVTAIDSLRPVSPTKTIRVVNILILAVAWVWISLVVGGDAVGVLLTVLTALLYLLVPWTAVNLVDYFFVRRGAYAITHMFRPDGIYGAWGTRGIIAYLIGFIVSIPFFQLPGVYEGPIAAAMNGVDVAWIVELVVCGVAYSILAKSLDLRREAIAIGESERELQALNL